MLNKIKFKLKKKVVKISAPVQKILNSLKKKFIFTILQQLVPKKLLKQFLFLKKQPLKIKKKKKKKRKKKLFKKNLKKKINIFLKLFLLDKYSLFNLIERKKKKILLIKNLKKKLNFKYNLKQNKFLLHISVRANNIFVNLLKYSKSKKKLIVIKFWSTGIFKLHCTKRQLKFTLYTLLKDIKQQLKNSYIYIIKILCAPFLHKHLYNTLKILSYKSSFIIYSSFKIFNGCRNKKKRRKKHLKFRILK